MMDITELEKFSNTMIKVYNNNSILKDICQVVAYSEQSKIDFFQIGERLLVPKRFFATDNMLDNSILASQFAMSVVSGEENFIIFHLNKLAKENKISTIKLTDRFYDSLKESIITSKVKPTNILLPIEYFRDIYIWSKEGKAEYIDKVAHLIVNEYKIKIHWSNKVYTPLDKIILLDRTGFEIVQKKFKDIPIPKGLKNTINSYGENENIRIDFAESKERDTFDLCFRSVIAINKISEKAVCLIELPKTGKSK